MEKLQNSSVMKSCSTFLSLKKNSKSVSRVLFRCSFRNSLSTIYLSDLPIAAPDESGKDGPPYPQPIWPFNIRGLPCTNITVCARALLPHVFTMTDWYYYQKATWFSVALSVTTSFLLSYPSFQMADYPVLPGLSSIIADSGRTTCEAKIRVIGY
jgi:hypothetical protein